MIGPGYDLKLPTLRRFYKAYNETPTMKGKTMFKRTTKPYFYGETNDHIVYLTENQARAANGIRIHDIKEENGSTFCQITLPDGTTVDDYSAAADILNEYLETHTVAASEEYLASNDILRPAFK